LKIIVVNYYLQELEKLLEQIVQ